MQGLCLEVIQFIFSVKEGTASDRRQFQLLFTAYKKSSPPLRKPHISAHTLGTISIFRQKYFLTLNCSHFSPYICYELNLLTYG